MARTALNSPADDSRLDALLHRLTAARATNIGFPAAVDVDYQPLAPLLGHLLNNVGDPDTDPAHPNHTKDFEREVVAFFAGLFRAPQRWSGYITSGGSESNLHALYLARSRYPDGIVFHSSAAHYSVSRAAHLLGMRTVVVAAKANGEIDYDEFALLAELHRSQPIIVVANVGTTMTEAIDDVGYLHDLLVDVGVTERYVHSDAALSGIPLALCDDPPAFDLADGADSICVSGHKFLGTPIPCSVVITRRHHTERVSRAVAYTSSRDSTITGSRNGLAAVMLWAVLQHHGRRGLRDRAQYGRELASHVHQRLQDIGWPSWRNSYAQTVVLRTPPPTVLARWPLPTADRHSHIICMPGINHLQVDRFVDDLAALTLPHSVSCPEADAPQRLRHLVG
ncbi:histidine decarboxylase [Micromonospora rubida]|uniref:Histidine decarboxylase n=1 Tax=Micromonospora rubida TaxID=2697657 RepID=A0ABW7SSE5_9ACTN